MTETLHQVQENGKTEIGFDEYESMLLHVAFMKEVLRFHPVGFACGRQTMEDSVISLSSKSTETIRNLVKLSTRSLFRRVNILDIIGNAKYSLLQLVMGVNVQVARSIRRGCIQVQRRPVPLHIRSNNESGYMRI